MVKLRIKNILWVFLLAIVLLSFFSYLTIRREKYELIASLSELENDKLLLEKEKENLLKVIEKEKELLQILNKKIIQLKDNLRATKNRLVKIFVDYAKAQKQIEDLGTRFMLLKTKNTSLAETNQKVMQENEELRTKLSSISELKKALGELKKQAHRVMIKLKEKADLHKVIEGNNGYLIKDGKPTYPPRVRIEVTPATSLRNE